MCTDGMGFILFVGGSFLFADSLTGPSPLLLPGGEAPFEDRDFGKPLFSDIGRRTGGRAFARSRSVKDDALLGAQHRIALVELRLRDRDGPRQAVLIEGLNLPDVHDDQVGCVVFSPIDEAEKALTRTSTTT